MKVWKAATNLADLVKLSRSDLVNTWVENYQEIPGLGTRLGSQEKKIMEVAKNVPISAKNSYTDRSMKSGIDFN